MSAPTGEPEDSPFEEEVGAVLRQRGYEVHTQVGCEGYRIDLAVLHPVRQGSYLLGIECDGATYHSARSARDRDKLRQRVLEVRGWKLHRIWSPDWWQDRDGEVQRLVEAIEAARLESTDEAGVVAVPAEPEIVHADVELDEEIRRSGSLVAARPYSAAPAPNHLRTEQDLQHYIVDVVRHEGPIRHELLMSRARVASGYAKAGRNVRAWLEGLIEAAVQSGTIEAENDAYIVDGTEIDMPRDWSSRPPAERRFDFVPDAELTAALRNVVQASFGIDANEAIREAFKLMGFRRTTDDTFTRARPMIDALIQSGLFVEQDGLLRLHRT